jgi:hypothetical protein
MPSEQMELKVAEGISGTWFYHLSCDEYSTRALCGERTMLTGVPLSAWGKRGHLNERWCDKCATAAQLAKGAEK